MAQSPTPMAVPRMARFVNRTVPILQEVIATWPNLSSGLLLRVRRLAAEGERVRALLQQPNHR